MDIPVVKIKGQLSQEILLAFVALLQLTRPVSSDIVQLEVEDLDGERLLAMSKR